MLERLKRADGSVQLAAALLLLVVILGALLLINSTGPERPEPRVEQGVVDLRSWDFARDGAVRLDGDWDYYPQQFVDPRAPPSPARTAAVPGTWDDSATPAGVPDGFGYASYRVRILLPPGAHGLGLRLITLSTAFELYANGSPVAGAGTLSDSQAGFAPAYEPLIARLAPPRDDRIDLVLQVANFAYARGGVWEPIWIGSRPVLQREREGRVGLAMFLAGAFWLMGLYHLILWATNPEDRSSLLFALLCFAVGVRGLTVDEVYLVDLVPSLTWDAVVRVEYGSMLAILALAAAFVRELFPDEQPRAVLGSYVVLSLFSLTLVALLPVDLFSRALGAMQVLVASAAIIAPVLVVRSLLRNREGAALFLVGVLGIGVATLHDILIATYRDLPTVNVFGGRLYLQPFGLFVFMLSQAIVLAMRASRARVQLEQTSRELAAARDEVDAYARDLEGRVARRTRALASVNQALASANRELELLAQVDGLTGIGNRRLFDAQFAAAWSDHLRRGAPLALILADVDNFKAYNDRYGHVAGDDALRAIADAVAEGVQRPRDVVARYGGEELVAVLPDTPLDGARHIAEAMRARIQALGIPHEDNPAGVVTVSFGVAGLVPDSPTGASDLVERADRALYAAKTAGRNRVEVDRGPPGAGEAPGAS